MYPLNFRFKCTDEFRDEFGSLTFGEINLLDNGLAVVNEVWVPKQAVEGHYSGHELKVSKLEHLIPCVIPNGASVSYTPPLLRLSKAKVNGNFNFVFHYQGTDGLEHIRNLGKSHQERIVSSFCYPSPVSIEGTIADYWEEHYKVKLKAPLITQKHIIVPAADLIFHTHCHQVASHQNSVV